MPVPADEDARSDNEDGLAYPRRFWAILSVVLSIVTLVSASTIVTVALPAITEDFATTPATAIWLVNGFQLALVVSLLPASVLGERIGHRALFQLGLSLFIVGAALSAFAASIDLLIAARVAQGAGAAAALSVTGALVRHIYPRSHLGTAISFNAFTVALASGIGPIAGSFILTAASWPWLFAASIPFGLMALVFSSRLPANITGKRPFDAVDAILNTLAFGLFVLAVEQLGTRQEFAIAALAMSFAAFILLLRHTRRIARPMLPLDLLAMPRLAFASSASVLCFASNVMVLTALPFYLINDLQRSQLEVGFLLSIRPFTLAPAALASGWLAGRMREESLCLAGTVIMAAGMIMTVVTPGEEYRLLFVVVGTALAGMGFALFQTPNNKVLLTTVPLNRIGGASVIQAMSREFGNAFGVGVLGLTFSLVLGAGSFYGILVGAFLACLAATLNGVRLWADRRS